jgi:transaldolase
MKPTQALDDLGQSIWLDNITRDLLDNGTLARYVDEFSVTGLTSNPTIFDHAIKSGDCEEVLAAFGKAGVDIDAFAAQLQNEGANSFVSSWNELMDVIAARSAALKSAQAG